MAKNRIEVFFLLALLTHPAWAAPGMDVPDVSILEQENRLRQDAEQKVQNEILNRILGEGRATALVSVEISVKSDRTESARTEGKVDDKKGLGDQDFILPWVPAPKTVNKSNEVAKDATVESSGGESQSVAVRQIVSRFDVTVIHDEGVSKQQLQLVDEAIRSAYARFQDVMKVIFKSSQFSKFEMSQKIKEGMWDFLKVQYLLPLLIAAFLFFFLFFVLAPFLKAAVKAMTAKKESATEQTTHADTSNKDEETSKSEEERAADMAAEMEEDMRKKQEEEEAKKFVPFAFVDETNLERLTTLIRREPPDIIAVVMSYLKPELVEKVLLSMPPELQAKVAMNMAAAKQLTQVEIRTLDAEIKEKIEFLVGGLHSLLSVLDSVDFRIRDNILEYLKNERPTLYEKVRRHILTFEDIMEIPDDVLQLVIREMKADNLAKALKDVSPEMVDKFTRNMSKGAAALLKEEMQYGRSLTSAQVNEERQRVVSTIKKMESEGRITVRKSSGDDFLDWEDMDMVSGLQKGHFGKSSLLGGGQAAAANGAAAKPTETSSEARAQAQSYSAAGAQMYSEGKYAEALQYLQYATQVDPSSIEGWTYLGNTYYALGQSAEALAAFDRVVALNPADAQMKAWVDQFRASVTAQTRT